MAEFWIRLGLICVLPWTANAEDRDPHPPGYSLKSGRGLLITRTVDPATLGARAMTWDKRDAAGKAADQAERAACSCIKGEDPQDVSCRARFAYSTQGGSEPVCGAPRRSADGPAKRDQKTLGRANPVRRLPGADLRSSR